MTGISPTAMPVFRVERVCTLAIALILRVGKCSFARLNDFLFFAALAGGWYAFHFPRFGQGWPAGLFRPICPLSQHFLAQSFNTTHKLSRRRIPYGTSLTSLIRRHVVARACCAGLAGMHINCCMDNFFQRLSGIVEPGIVHVPDADPCRPALLGELLLQQPACAHSGAAVAA